jgi:excalibur calcium-binding domain-containing protein
MRALLFLIGASAFGLLFGYAWSAVPAPAQRSATAQSAGERPTSKSIEQSVYFATCTAARDAGAAPLYAGQPGYSEDLDQDGDGVACEPGSRD